MNRSPNPPYALGQEVIFASGSVRGAGAAAPTVPTTTLSTSSSLHPMAAADNLVTSTARSDVGVYTLTLKEHIPVILDIIPNVWGGDGRQARITDYNPATKVVSVECYDVTGVADDLESTDNLKLTIIGRLSV